MLDLVKKNVAIIVCVLIAVGAIVANFIPLGGFRQDLATRAGERAGLYNSINELLTKQRTLPNVDPNNAEAKPLEGFPTEAVIKRGNEVTQALTGKSDSLFEAVAKLNEKPLLEPGSLPSPDFVQGGRFLQAYQRAVDVSPSGRANSLPVRTMRAGFAPTQDDLAREQAEARQRIEQTRAIVQDGQIRNQEEVAAAIAAELPLVQDRLIREAAEKSLVYINLDTMDVQQGLINANTVPEPSVIFWAQMGLWVQEELFRAINDTNTGAGATSVGQSPIKHLLKVLVPPNFVGLAAASADPNAPPVAPSTDPNAPLQANFAASPTGRVSNGLFDVMHGEVSMVVEAEKLSQVLAELGRGRLMSVIQVRRVEPVDSAAAANAGYFYGDKACVRVDLQVEFLLMRKWTERYMPERIRTMLGLPAAAGAAPAAPPPG